MIATYPLPPPRRMSLFLMRVSLFLELYLFAIKLSAVRTPSLKIESLDPPSPPLPLEIICSKHKENWY